MISTIETFTRDLFRKTTSALEEEKISTALKDAGYSRIVPGLLDDPASLRASQSVPLGFGRTASAVTLPRSASEEEVKAGMPGGAAGAAREPGAEAWTDAGSVHLWGEGEGVGPVVATLSPRRSAGEWSVLVRTKLRNSRRSSYEDDGQSISKGKMEIKATTVSQIALNIESNPTQEFREVEIRDSDCKGLDGEPTEVRKHRKRFKQALAEYCNQLGHARNVGIVQLFPECGCKPEAVMDVLSKLTAGAECVDARSCEDVRRRADEILRAVVAEKAPEHYLVDYYSLYGSAVSRFINFVDGEAVKALKLKADYTTSIQYTRPPFKGGEDGVNRPGFYTAVTMLRARFEYVLVILNGLKSCRSAIFDKIRDNSNEPLSQFELDSCFPSKMDELEWPVEEMLSFIPEVPSPERFETAEFEVEEFGRMFDALLITFDKISTLAIVLAGEFDYFQKRFRAYFETGNAKEKSLAAVLKEPLDRFEAQALALKKVPGNVNRFIPDMRQNIYNFLTDVHSYLMDIASSVSPEHTLSKRIEAALFRLKEVNSNVQNNMTGEENMKLLFKLTEMVNDIHSIGITELINGKRHYLTDYEVFADGAQRTLMLFDDTILLLSKPDPSSPKRKSEVRQPPKNQPRLQLEEMIKLDKVLLEAVEHPTYVATSADGEPSEEPLSGGFGPGKEDVNALLAFFGEPKNEKVSKALRNERRVMQLSVANPSIIHDIKHAVATCKFFGDKHQFANKRLFVNDIGNVRIYSRLVEKFADLRKVAPSSMCIICGEIDGNFANVLQEVSEKYDTLGLLLYSKNLNQYWWCIRRFGTDPPPTADRPLERSRQKYEERPQRIDTVDHLRKTIGLSVQKAFAIIASESPNPENQIIRHMHLRHAVGRLDALLMSQMSHRRRDSVNSIRSFFDLNIFRKDRDRAVSVTPSISSVMAVDAGFPAEPFPRNSEDSEMSSASGQSLERRKTKFNIDHWFPTRSQSALGNYAEPKKTKAAPPVTQNAPPYIQQNALPSVPQNVVEVLEKVCQEIEARHTRNVNKYTTPQLVGAIHLLVKEMAEEFIIAESNAIDLAELVDARPPISSVKDMKEILEEVGLLEKAGFKILFSHFSRVANNTCNTTSKPRDIINLFGPLIFRGCESHLKKLARPTTIAAPTVTATATAPADAPKPEAMMKRRLMRSFTGRGFTSRIPFGGSSTKKRLPAAPEPVAAAAPPAPVEKELPAVGAASPVIKEGAIARPNTPAEEAQPTKFFVFLETLVLQFGHVMRWGKKGGDLRLAKSYGLYPEGENRARTAPPRRDSRQASNASTATIRSTYSMTMKPPILPNARSSTTLFEAHAKLAAAAEGAGAAEFPPPRTPTPRAESIEERSVAESSLVEVEGVCVARELMVGVGPVDGAQSL
ncbi:hypothetical protein HDU96_008230 [Phlyctochytrium bullatum]|nr:hypothetical protein HDU96_008230 [Phlyctochytrium bullatum]